MVYLRFPKYNLLGSPEDTVSTFRKAMFSSALKSDQVLPLRQARDLCSFSLTCVFVVFSLFNRVLSFLWSPFTVITESAYSALTRIQELPFLFRHFWHYWLFFFFFFFSFLFVYIITFRRLLKVPWLPAVNFPRLCCTQEIWPKHKHLIIFVTFFFEFDTNIYFNLKFFFAWGILELFYTSWVLSARSHLRCHSYKCHSLGGIFLQHFL